MTNADNNFTGNFFIVLGNFTIWPATREQLVLHTKLEKGVIDVFATPSSTLKVVLTLKSGELAQVDTCPIVSGPELSLFLLCVTWNFPDIDVRINGRDVASTDTAKVVERSIKWSAPENDNRPTTFKDVTLENEQCRTQRITEVSSLRTRPDRLPASNEKPYEDLSNALKQLRDQIAAIKRGEIHQDTALAARLRALICRPPRQHPLLQRCAGEVGLPLTLYGIPPLLPQYWDPNHDGDNASLVLSIETNTTPVKTIATQVAMDLDFWLRMRSANLGSKPYTNDEVVRAFADTEGAHYDKGVEPLVQALRDIKQSSAKMTMLHKYFLMTAECVLVLGEYLLQEKSTLANK